MTTPTWTPLLLNSPDAVVHSEDERFAELTCRLSQRSKIARPNAGPSTKREANVMSDTARSKTFMPVKLNEDGSEVNGLAEIDSGRSPKNQLVA
jgi:hypothetical protein